MNTHRTKAASFLRALLHEISPRMPICICMTCIQPFDDVVATAGDFLICDRCGKDITSFTGLAVRSAEASEDKPQ